MIASSTHSLFSVTRQWLLLLVFLLGMLCMIQPVLTWLAVAAFALACGWRGYHAYQNESYSAYCALMLFQALSMMPSFALLLMVLLGTKLGWPLPVCLALGSLPALLTFAVYRLVRAGMVKQTPYKIRGNRVYPSVKERKVNLVWLGAGLGITSLLMPQIRDVLASPIVMLILTSALSVVTVISIRGTIAALRQLKETERQNGYRYSFPNLEEIQALRSRSWPARAFIAFSNKLKER